jgi:hypothetical protein
MKSIWLVASLSLGMSSLCVADEPTSPPPEPTPAASAVPTSAATPATPATTPAVADATEAQIKQIRAHGYKPQKRKDGVTMWCKSEAPLGSRFEKTTCSSAQDILQMEQNAQDVTKNAQRLGTAGKLNN